MHSPAREPGPIGWLMFWLRAHARIMDHADMLEHIHRGMKGEEKKRPPTKTTPGRK
jgi:hypothetical protein